MAESREERRAAERRTSLGLEGYGVPAGTTSRERDFLETVIALLKTGGRIYIEDAERTGILVDLSVKLKGSSLTTGSGGQELIKTLLRNDILRSARLLEEAREQLERHLQGGESGLLWRVPVEIATGQAESLTPEEHLLRSMFRISGESAAGVGPDSVNEPRRTVEEHQAQLVAAIDALRFHEMSDRPSVRRRSFQIGWIAATLSSAALVFVPLALPPAVIAASAACALVAGLRLVVDATSEALKR
jgi:hypothetical protein